MKNEKEIKEIVKEKYGQIAVQSDFKQETSCCGSAKSKSSSCCGSDEIVDYSVFGDDYTQLQGYVAEADLNLGCGLPTEHAGINIGDTVIDLGSGAGNDVFIARSIVGETGRVIGLDMTPEMIEKANRNNLKLDYKNVEFLFGEIEDMPIEDSIADVVISNCVLNLVPNKEKAFSEIYRILKPGAHFCVSDIVTKGEMPENAKESAALYAGCVSGALKQDEYLGIIKNNGFKNIEVKKSKIISIPDEVLNEYLSPAEITKFKTGEIGIISITVVGYK